MCQENIATLKGNDISTEHHYFFFFNLIVVTHYPITLSIIAFQLPLNSMTVPQFLTSSSYAVYDKINTCT